MKIAVSGKGGVGKTTISAFIIKALSEDGYNVLAVDADPDANLAHALGFKSEDKITPIAEMKELIAERTGAEPGSMGGFFKLNPRVSDIPDKFCQEENGIRLMVLGGVKSGGSGCICPESTLLKSLVQHLFLERDDMMILDMEAGIEHLGRAVASSVDVLLIVVEPNLMSIDTANNIKKLSADIGIERLCVVANKIRQDSEIEFIKSKLRDLPFIGHLPYTSAIYEKDLSETPLNVHDKEVEENTSEILKKILSVNSTLYTN